jgi:hypothetical protein
MLEFLDGEASSRKLRLLACACCHRVWHLLCHEDSRQAVDLCDELSEEKANTIDDDSIHTLYQKAVAARWDFLNDPVAAFAATAAESLLAPLESFGKCWRSKLVCKYIVCALEGERLRAEGVSEKKLKSWAKSCHNINKPQRLHYLGAQAIVAAILSDIFGPLSFRPITVSHAVLAWNDSVVVRLAQAAYEERHLPEGTLDITRLFILADALEEAGCSDPDILGHLRGPGPHVRGCWVVDLLLGRE